MAVITPDTFRPLRRPLPPAPQLGYYVGVRLQQGVPLVDADWNELEDIRRFEVQAYLKWFVGNGVPESPVTAGVRQPDGFRIIASGGGVANDFVVDDGITGPVDGLANVGRCLVNGLDAMIDASIAYRSQPLHVSQGPSAVAEANRLGLQFGGGAPATIAEVPSLDGIVSVYIDVWERLVNVVEDPTLVQPSLGTESCVRRKREWVVRTRAGLNEPRPGDPDFITGHNYYVLAHVTRRSTDPVIRDSDIADRRERRLFTLPATLTQDLFGVEAIPYRRGEGRPAIDLRAAINALIRGDLPGMAERAIASAPGTDFVGRGFVLDGVGNIAAFWRSLRAGGDHLFASRLSTTNPSAGFLAATQITAGGAGFRDPHAARTGPDRIFLAYQRGVAGGADIVFRHDSYANIILPAALETVVANTAGLAETRPFVVVSGDFVVVFFHRDTTGWMYRRWRLSTSAWEDATSVQISQLGTFAGTIHAAVDTGGNVWVAASDTNVSNIVRLNPSTGTTGAVFTTPLGGAGSVNESPFVVCPRVGGLAIDAWLFWRRSSGAMFAVANSGGVWRPAVPVIGASAAQAREPAAVEDSDGTIWLLWSEGPLAPVANGNIMLGRFSQVTSTLIQSRALIGSTDDDAAPFALIEPNDVIWLFWSRNTGGANIDVFVKQVVTKV
jgi:hypothetical protein